MRESYENTELTVTETTVQPVNQNEVEMQSVSGKTGDSASMLNIPGRFMIFLHSSHSLPLKAGLMVLVFISAVYTKAYTGEMQWVINDHIGGIFYVLFGSLAFSLIMPRARIYLPVILATTATSILEFVQWFQFPFMTKITGIKAFAYLLGNSFNPTDFIYYGMGAVAAVLTLWVVRE